jgi:tRNA pseudouridine38-40 synthase
LDEGEGVLRYEIRALAFCWQMVRSIVGTMVDMGTGGRRAGEVMGMLRSKDRAAAGRVAPAHGLCLWEVGYH